MKKLGTKSLPLKKGVPEEGGGGILPVDTRDF